MSPRVILVALVLSVAALVGAIVFDEYSSPDQRQHERFMQLLVERHSLDQAIARDALESRFAFESNYDALAKRDRDLRELEGQLRAAVPDFVRAHERADLNRALMIYDRLSSQRGQLLERFKSENALLRNSVGYFPSAAALALYHVREPELVEQINELRASTLSLALKDDGTHQATFRQALDEILVRTRGTLLEANQRRVHSMLAHARAIAVHKSGTDGLLKQVLELPIDDSRRALGLRYDHAFARAEERRRVFGRFVSALSLVLLGIVAYAGVRLQRAAASLGRANERLEVAVKERTAELEGEMVRRAHIELELRQAQKLEAVGQLASGIAHEINTPIQYVGDSIYFLRQAFDDIMRLVEAYRSAVAQVEPRGIPALSACEQDVQLELLRVEVPEAIERTADGARQVTSIVKAMKTFAHTSVDKAPVDLNAAIENTLTVARNEYKYVADLELELGTLPDVVCNAGGIRQVLLNLIINAAHAIDDKNAGSEARGTIRIRTEHREKQALIAIQDSGGGVPEAIRDRIFDPFFTTKGPGRGTGQGLTISQSIVTQHGGKLFFETAPGVGTTFFVQLPVEGEDAHDVDDAERAA